METRIEMATRLEIEVAISHVCRSWRSISIACPELWSTFNHPSGAVQRQESIHRLVTYLERSRNKLLNLSFHVSSEGRSVGRPAIANVLETIIPSRWRQLSISITQTWPANYFFERLESLSAPNLELLEICTSEFNVGRIQRVTYRRCFLRGTPKLISLRMDSRCFISYHPPITNLTTIQLENPSSYPVIYTWPSFLALIGSSTLVNLSLAGNLFGRPLSDTNVARCMWDFIRAPRLQLLVLKGTPVDQWTLPHSIVSGANNPPLFPSLKVLAIVNCKSTHGATYRLAEATKNITRLVVSQEPLGQDSVVEYIIQVQILWPHLKDLTFLNFAEYYFDGLDASEALALVERRVEILQTHFTIGILDRHDDWWRQADPVSWLRLRQGNFLRPIVTPEDASDHVPWPPRDITNFRPSSELPFIT
ncbi:hypothetical protein BDZ97DRAFT_1836557 [Flammula alnicola]|nr:hypothetical protein BDZ97DRAFT_1836557 [Flammula alnicola]